MKVRCIKEISDAYTERSVTVGNVYDVITSDNISYQLRNDEGLDRYYALKFFVEVNEGSMVLDPSNYTVSIISIDKTMVFPETLSYLSSDRYMEFKDIHINEHLYSSNVIERVRQYQALPRKVEEQLTQIKDECVKHRAAYFRIVEQ